MLALVLGCGSSFSPSDTDGGISFDATPMEASTPDAEMDSNVVRPPAGECGDGMLDPMEQCDDGNTEDADGCDSMCRRESFCGDGTQGADELCDDGNNRSGDGGRSDCQ